MKAKKRNNKLPVALYLFPLLYWILLAFYKYHINGLSLLEFDPFFTGNFFGLILMLLSFAAYPVILLTKRVVEPNRQNLLLVIQIISILFLAVAFIISNFVSFDPQDYILLFPVKKVYTGLLLTAGLFLQIYSLIYIWGIVVGFEKLYEIRTLFRTLAFVVLLIVFSLFIVWDVKDFEFDKNLKQKFEFALIPGAAVYSKGKPSPLFEARIRKALELYRAKKIEKIILTGGNAPGEITEAEAAFRYLLNLGVDPKKMFVDKSTSTTVEQIRFLRSHHNLVGKGNKILAVSDGFHLTRILEIAKFFNIDAVGISSDYRLTFEKTLFYRSRESIALLLFWFFSI